MKRYVFLTFLLFLLYFIFQSEVIADVPNPNYFTAKCDPGEVEVKCTWSRKSINSPIQDNCVKYDNNPNYQFLEGTGSTFGGKSKYCFKPVSTSSLVAFHLKSFLPLTFITLLIELPIFIFFNFKTKKAILTIVIVNLISVLLLYIAPIILALSGILALIMMEFLILVLETILIKARLKEINLRKIIASVLVANIASAVIGSLVLTFIYNH